jgi:hypothetical protein
MIPIQIQSRMINSMYFDPKDGRLHLVLANGDERRFSKVSADAVAALVNAPSPGTHYVQTFRHNQKRVA